MTMSSRYSSSACFYLLFEFFFSISSLPTNKGEHDITKFMLHFATSNKSLIVLYSVACMVQAVNFAVRKKIVLKSDDKEFCILSSEEIEGFKAVFEQLEVFDEAITESHINVAMKAFSIFLRRVAITLNSINRVYSKSLNDVVSRKMDKTQLLNLMKYCGMPYESVVSVFDCGGSANLSKYPKIWLNFDISEIYKIDARVLSEELNIETSRLIELPEKFTDLTKKGYQYQCKEFLKKTQASTGGSNASQAVQLTNNTSSEAVMCMFCGEMLCWRGSCCRVQDENGKILGGVNQHARKCSNGFVFVFRIAKNRMFAWNGEGGDVNGFGGSMRSGLWAMILTPYVDKYGEFDPGLERYQPLFLNKEHYNKIIMLFLTHQLFSTFNPTNRLNLYTEDGLSEL